MIRLTPASAQRAASSTGGLRFATTTGYFLANPPGFASLHFRLEFAQNYINCISCLFVERVRDRNYKAPAIDDAL